MKRYVIAAAMLAASAISARADKFYVYGSGTQSCGAWLNDLSNWSGHEHKFSWVLGFLSGAGYVGPDYAHTDSDAVEVWITNYCQTNPLKYISDAAEALTKELEKKQ